MAIDKPAKLKTPLSCLALALALCSHAHASPLENNEPYGCVVEAAHILTSESSSAMRWADAPKSFSLIEKSCFAPKDKPDVYIPSACAGHYTYLEMGPRDVVIQNFGSSELLFGSTLNDKAYSNAYIQPISLSFLTETRVMISKHSYTNDNDAAVFRLTANCFALGSE